MAEKNRNPLVQESSERNSASILRDISRAQRATAPLPDRVDGVTALPRGEERSAASVQPQKPRTVSERKLQANRANAKKSSGPRTPRGKAWSRRNAVKHGLSAKTVLFRSDQTPIEPGLQAIWGKLQEWYIPEDGRRTDPALVHRIVMEWSHQRTAAELEESCFQNAFDDFGARESLRKLHRYRTTSHRNLLKDLAKLRALPRRESREE